MGGLLHVYEETSYVLTATGTAPRAFDHLGNRVVLAVPRTDMYPRIVRQSDSIPHP